MPDVRFAELARIFCGVLERQAFLFAESMDPDGVGAEPGSWLRATIRFGGTAPGVLSLAAGEPMAREAAANFLGTSLEDPSVEANHRDALGEILNMVCGHMLTALHDLGIPALEDISSLDAEAMAGTPGCLAFLVEDHPVLLAAEFPALPGGGREASR